jgi:hypothetical protein
MAVYLRAGMRETMIMTVSGRNPAPETVTQGIACFRMVHKPGNGTTAMASGRGEGTAAALSRGRTRRPVPAPAAGWPG